jgi:quercetin dioxygenase-like cupin family protein
VSSRIVTPADADPRRFMGHLFNWRLTGEVTGGALSLVEVHGWRGGEPPLHVHSREDELFMLLEGEATFMVGDEVRSVRAGASVWAPRGVPHAFRFDTPTVRMLIAMLPAGQEAVFHAFSMHDPARRPAAQPAEDEMPDMAALEAADAAAGVTYVGPPLAELLGAAQPG